MVEVELENVVKDIKGVRIIDHVSIRLHSGKIYGLRGKNGCGKTMLMRIVCGLIRPTDGTVRINEQVLHKDIDFPPSIGALIENPSFLKQYTGFKNLRMLGNLQGNISDEDIASALQSVGLEPSDVRTYKKYSLGMKQKLGIANAIMGRPDIIVLDEPINALDEDSVRLVKRILLELKNDGKLILIACHDREELEYLSDTVINMRDGKVIGTEDIGYETDSPVKA